MGWNQGGGASRRAVTKQETKVCPLCGALNHQRNGECFSCGWHGQFEEDQAAIDYRWQRLVERHEEVRLEHLVARGSKSIGDFGVVRKTYPWQRLCAACARRWRAFLARRNARCAAREASLRPKTGSRHR